ncbi:MAG: hypothetical protein LBP93_09035, partial [Treponema sp.]|nr:hypothetical protein [Treponema sp.]
MSLSRVQKYRFDEKVLVLICCLFCAGATIFGGGTIQESPPYPPAPSSTTTADPRVPAEIPVQSGEAVTERPAPDRGESIMKALAAAYPDRVGPAEFRNGDWAVP